MRDGIKIIGISVGNYNLGSSRIRYFKLLDNLPDNCHWAPFNNDLDAEILFIQKAATPLILSIVESAILRGLEVIYDIDDKITSNDQLKLMDLASVVTVDTSSRKKKMGSLTKTPIIVIPPSIDYNIDKPPPFTIRDSIQIIGTYGNTYNIDQARTTLSQFDLTYRIDIIDEAEWSYASFINRIITHDLEVLCHADTEVGNQKSASRLINTMALGLPTLVSNTEGYASLMSSVGHEELIIREKIDIKRLDRDTIYNHFIDYAWDNYRPCVVADKFYQQVLT